MIQSIKHIECLQQCHQRRQSLNFLSVNAYKIKNTISGQCGIIFCYIVKQRKVINISMHIQWPSPFPLMEKKMVKLVIHRLQREKNLLFLSDFIVSIVKNARESISSKDNYWPIALTSTLSKQLKNLSWPNTVHCYKSLKINLELKVIVQLICVHLTWNK